MGAPAKFLFDTDFSLPHKSKERAPTTLEIAQQVAAAESAAYQRGFDAAQREAKVQSDRRMAAAIESIAAGIKAVAERFAGIEARMETEAVDVAVAAARKLCSALIATEPSADIIALVRDSFRHLVSTPHLVVRINDQLYDATHDQIEAMAKQTGFAGRLVILAEPDVATGDCKIEWADGGIVLERAAIDASIDELVRGYMASRKSNSAP